MGLRALNRRRGGHRPTQVDTIRARPRCCFASSWPLRCGLEAQRRHLAAIVDAAPASPPASFAHRRRVATAAASAAAPAAATPTPLEQQQQLAVDEAAVSTLLGWAQANGVDISRVGVFVEPNGERGFVAADPIAAKGDPLLVVPLRLALVDARPQQQPPSPYYDGSPWSVRLASRLLREASLGANSPWSAYVRALPRSVPAASAWGWDAVRSLRDPRCEAEVHAASWLADDSFERLSPRAPEVWGQEIAALEREEQRERWQWALSCVHSRTFLVTSEDGRMGARAMVPLIDLVNHAGDEARVVEGNSSSKSCSFGRAAAEGAQARDNVRWDLARAPTPSGNAEEWALALTALRPIARGEELLLSYGERSNDDFLTHYGFVPRLNAHDDVELFSAASASSAASGGQQDDNDAASSKEEAEARSRAAAEAALEEAAEWHWAQRRQQEEDEAAAAERYGAAVARAVEAELQGRAPGDKGGLRVTAGSRVSPGLVALFAELERGQQQPQRAAERLVARRCWEVLRERGLALLADLAALALAEAEAEGEEDESDSPFSTWLLPYYYRTLVVEKGLCSPDGAWAVEGGGAGGGGDDGGSSDPLALARRVLGGDVKTGDYESRLATAFRAYKAMILADCVLDSGASLRELV
jgi:hypothetical protein